MNLKLTPADEVDVDNPVEGDLHLSSGDVVWLGKDGFDPAEFAQRIRCRLRMFKNEWFLNTDEGVPYFDEIFEKGITDGRVVSIIQGVIVGTPGVVSAFVTIDDRDRAARTISVSFEAELENGYVLKSTDFAPFVVEVQ
jgi:hypothetical protein